MITSQLLDYVSSKKLDQKLSAIYGEENLAGQRERYIEAINDFLSIYGDRECSLFSVPGRSEISGNHTDHNHGKVLAGSINLDIIAVASKTVDGVIKIKSKGFPEDSVDTNSYTTLVVERLCHTCNKCAGFEKVIFNRGCV